MIGGEYMTEELLLDLWEDIDGAFKAELAESGEDVQAFLKRRNPVWNVVGRVCFHLAENKRSEHTPFAFMATYASRLSSGARIQHLPLSRALKEYADSQDREILLSLLLPVQRAAARSPFLKKLVDSRAVFRPQAWTSEEAYRFLQDVPVFEESGVIVRIPDWWSRRGSRHPMVSVSVGEAPPSRLGFAAMLDFSVDVVLDGEPLTEKELRDLLEAAGGLALIKGRWVEVDPDRLRQVLTHWKEVKRSAANGELSFAEGMRLLAGTGIEQQTENEAAAVSWSEVVAGEWLQEVLASLRSPEVIDASEKVDDLKATLRPYQQVGAQWLWFLHRLGLGACLADDMGLGKTIQVLSLLLRVRQQPDSGASLLVVPASLIANWKSEIERFAPALRTLIAHSSEMPAAKLKELSDGSVAEHDVVITSYASLLRVPWLAEFPWHVVVLDEAQAIKNPGTRQTRAAKALKSRTRMVLTGTPIENRLSDLWSLFDFICPGLLGTAAQFGRYTKRLSRGDGRSYGPLRRLVRPYILRRLKTDKKIIADLPEKTELRAWCWLSRRQAALYQESVEELAERLRTLEGMERRGVVLSFLLRFKQICNHPS